MMPRSSHHHAQGFTLLELVLVIALLGAIALAATALFDTTLDQTRYDDTKVRLETIRRAMIGDASRTLNNAPEISGFVADMGRLPTDLQELIERESLPVWDLHSLPVSGVAGELGSGWRGPYVQTLPESDGTRAFRDGWGNAGAAPNYGWTYSASSAVAIQSLGLDGVASGVGYAADYPSGNLVALEDWQEDLNGQTIVVTFNKVPNQTVTLQLRIYYALNGSVVSTPWSSLSFAMSGVSASGVQSTANVTFPTSAQPLPIGRHAAVVWCLSDHTSTVQNVVYNGDCNAASNPSHSPYYFTLVPRNQLPTIQWTIQ